MKESVSRWQTLDVRDDLRKGKEPIAKILAAAAKLGPGEGLRLLAPFEPVPLYTVLGNKGFAHQTSPQKDGSWEIRFYRETQDTLPSQKSAGQALSRKAREQLATEDWPPPKLHLDNRGLLPPEPMMSILSALETLQPGEVLEAINDREPQFLFPELDARGHAIAVQLQDAGVRLLIRHSGQHLKEREEGV